MKLQSKIKDALYVQSEKAWHFDSGNQQRECACWCPTWSVDDQPANWICVSSLDGLLVLILGCIAAHTHDTHIDISQYPKKRKEKIIDPMHNCCVILVCLFVVSCCFFQILFHFTGIATKPDCGFSVMGPRCYSRTCSETEHLWENQSGRQIKP